MSKIFVIAWQDIKRYYKSSLFYIVTALFSLIVGWGFFNLLVNYIEHTQNLPESVVGQVTFVQAVVFRLFGNINFVLLFLTPLISMRLIAEEKKQKSLEFLLTAPVTNLQIVLGKYLASLVIVLSIVATTFIFPLILKLSGLNETGNIVSGYIAIFCNTALFLGFGILASSFSENQIVAAIIAVISVLFLWMISWASMSTSNYYLAELYRYLGLVDHFDALVRGWFRLSDLMYFASFIFFSLFATVKVMDSRNW